MKNIHTYNFSGKKALIRVDFNVPLDENFTIKDDTRIQASLPTIKKILNDDGAVILMSHLGRPKNGPEKKFSLQHLVSHLSGLLSVKVKFADDCIGEKTEKIAAVLKNGEVLLLENLRFYNEEKKGNEAFAKKLAALGDVYVNDAFGTAHREHASTAVIAKFFPKDKMFGYLMESEVTNIRKVIEQTQHPFTAILGGAKISTKIDVITNLLDKVNHIIIGGGMAFTFIKAKGGKIGSSLIEEDYLETAREIMKKAENKGTFLHLPSDAVCADTFSNDAKTKITSIEQIPDGWIGLDIGPATIKQFNEVISQSKTILWNGPMGVFEMSNFTKGTKEVADTIVHATQKGAYSLVGGGDSVAAVNQFHLADKMSYISTGGGALLEYLEGKELPGIKAMMETNVVLS